MTEIAGYYHNLAIGLRENGICVSEFYLSNHAFKYNEENSTSPLLFRIYRRLKLKRKEVRSNVISRIFYYSFGSLISYCFLFWALLKFDIFVFGFGTSILNDNKDLKLLRKLNKKVISVIIHGSESRPPYINGAKRLPNGNFYSPSELSRMSQLMKAQLEVIEQNSDFVLAAPFTSQFLEKPFINHFCIGLPFKSKITHLLNNDVTGDSSVRILHSPSKPEAKGTFAIREIIQSLKDKGYNIDYIEIINKPNSVVIDELQKCDFVIDQLYSDTPLAGFATEAAFYGKPAIVGGYGWETLKSLLPRNIFPPSEICQPMQLEDSIIKLIVNKQYRLELGRQAFEFVTEHWEAKVVSAKFAKLFSGEIDPDWYINPSEVNYVFGAGVSASEGKYLVSEIIKQRGKEGLSLKGNKSLESAFINFANERSQVDLSESTF
ncbi:Glycosyltransferase involved in cell wall bisynthesis [Algoriphagus boritolerans DSM 17298 = JCM 18970]|uniref:Glycosyltransferase involved in cell wall bisynthesis n=2 Tax=Algoriphagus TaxID=246875 RepID=A0A1H5RTL8_9BACT|nr:Glycosyltransferase involved in cell wall bisynthesis [Algoriphagus boritolerans DSM 17298 = JCM 18970]